MIKTNVQANIGRTYLERDLKLSISVDIAYSIDGSNFGFALDLSQYESDQWSKLSAGNGTYGYRVRTTSGSCLLERKSTRYTIKLTSGAHPFDYTTAVNIPKSRQNDEEWVKMCNDIVDAITKFNAECEEESMLPYC